MINGSSIELIIFVVILSCHFFIDTQGRSSYAPAVKKQCLIKKYQTRPEK